MKNGKVNKWLLTFGGTGAFIGIIIGNLIAGNLDSGSVLGAFTALLLMFIIDLIRMRMKKDKTPDFDERTRHNMMKFYAFAANIFIGILFLSIGIISLMDMDQLSVSYLFIPFMIYFVFSGIGALIVSRK